MYSILYLEERGRWAVVANGMILGMFASFEDAEKFVKSIQDAKDKANQILGESEYND